MKKQQTENIKKTILKDIKRHYLQGDYYPHYSQKLGKWSAGCSIELLKDNKPATIQKAADISKINYLIIFRNYEQLKAARAWWGGVLVLTRWNTEKAKAEKCTTSTRSPRELLKGTYTNQDAETARKTAGACFLVSVAPLYDETDKVKQEQRKANQRPKTTAEKIEKLTPTTDADKLAEGIRYTYRGGGWYNSTLYIYDANGNELNQTRAALHHRARDLHKTRARAAWLALDHGELIQQLEAAAATFQKYIMNLCLKQNYNFYLLHTLEALGEAHAHALKSIEKIKSGEIYDTDTLNERIKIDNENLYKCFILGDTLADDPRAYGWIWWQRDGDGLRCTLESNKTEKKYYQYITAQKVGIMEA